MKSYKLSLLIFAASAVAAVPFLHWHKPTPPDLPQARSHPIVRPTPAAHHFVKNARAEAQSLSWAERLLENYSDEMPRGSTQDSPEDSDPGSNSEGDAFRYVSVQETEGWFQAIAAKYGPSTRACRGIGRCELRQGHYDKAVDAFATALQLSPADTLAASAHRESQELFTVSQALLPLLSRDDTIVQMRRYPQPVPGQSWIVLCAKKLESGTGEESELEQSPFPLTGPLILRLFTQEHGRYRCLWTTSDRDGCGPLWQDEVYDANVYVQDLAGTGVPQVVFHETFPGGSTEPSHLEIFSWQGGGLIQSLNLKTTWPFCVEDIAHAGALQVWMTQEIGFEMCHAQQPRWTDVYAWKNGRFRLADRQYPKDFQHWVPDLQESLHDNPGDADILAHLGATYDILGRQRDADRAFRGAERAIQNANQCAETFADIARAYRIAGRTGRAEQYYRRAIRACKSEQYEEYYTALASDLREEMREASEDVSGNWDN